MIKQKTPSPSTSWKLHVFGLSEKVFSAQRKHRDVMGCFLKRIGIRNSWISGRGFQPRPSSQWQDMSTWRGDHCHIMLIMKWSRHNVWYHFVSFHVAFHVLSFQHVWYHLISLLYTFVSFDVMSFQKVWYHVISFQDFGRDSQQRHSKLMDMFHPDKSRHKCCGFRNMIKTHEEKNSVEAPSWFPLLEDRNWGKNQKKVQINPPWHYFSHLGKLTLKMMAWKFGISSSSPLF